MDSLEVKDRLENLEEQLEEISRFAQKTQEKPARKVNRPYTKMVSAAEDFDELAEEIGLKICSQVDTDGETVEFFWKNELWNHSDFTVDDEVKVMLETLYRLPFSYELSEAYGDREKVDMAQFALSEIRQKKQEVAELEEYV